MAGARYTVYFQFRNGPSDPRISVTGFESLAYYNEIVGMYCHVVPSAPGDIHRSHYSFHTPQNHVETRRANESETHWGDTSDRLMKLVFTNTMHRLVVASLDDESLSKSEKHDILKLLMDHNHLGFHEFEDFVRKTTTSQPDEIYLQDLCIAFITSSLHLDSPQTTSLRVQMLRLLFEKHPPLPHSQCAPHCSIEIADENSWLLTSYYPTPQQHRLFLGAPLELESPTGLRFRVHVIDNGSPSVALLE